jgi:hypothetical protein
MEMRGGIKGDIGLLLSPVYMYILPVLAEMTSPGKSLNAHKLLFIPTNFLLGQHYLGKSGVHPSWMTYVHVAVISSKKLGLS